MSKIAFFVLAWGVCFPIGCCRPVTDPPKTTRLPAVPNFTTDYQGVCLDASQVKSSVAILAQRIDKQAEFIETIADPCYVSDQHHESEIITAAQAIQEDANELNTKAAKLDSIIIASAQNEKEMESVVAFIERADELETELERCNEVIAQLESRSAQRHQDMWMWISGLGAIAVVAGVVMIFLKMIKMGIGLVVGGICVSSLGYFMSEYTQYVAVFGGILFFGVIGVMIRMVHVKNRALAESVLSTELLKDKLKVGWDQVKGEIAKVQSKRTKDIIWQIRDTEIGQ